MATGRPCACSAATPASGTCASSRV